VQPDEFGPENSSNSKAPILVTKDKSEIAKKSKTIKKSLETIKEESASASPEHRKRYSKFLK
jgi:hypothetical protein